jgi:hypothetical protein
MYYNDCGLIEGEVAASGSQKSIGHGRVKPSSTSLKLSVVQVPRTANDLTTGRMVCVRDVEWWGLFVYSPIPAFIRLLVDFSGLLRLRGSA